MFPGLRCITMSILFYKKPFYIPKEPGPLSGTNCQKYVERAGLLKDTIPEELSFENILEGRTLPVSSMLTCLPCAC